MVETYNLGATQENAMPSYDAIISRYTQLKTSFGHEFENSSIGFYHDMFKDAAVAHPETVHHLFPNDSLREEGTYSLHDLDHRLGLLEKAVNHMHEGRYIAPRNSELDS